MQIFSFLLFIKGLSDHVGTFTKHGMPSDHAQTIFYFMTFFSLVVIFRYSIKLNLFLLRAFIF